MSVANRTGNGREYSSLMDGHKDSELDRYKRQEANQKHLDDIYRRAELERIDDNHAWTVGALALVIVILLGILLK